MQHAKRILSAACAAALLWIPGLSSAADYYVAPGGNDSSAGSATTPWRTLQKAANTAAAGDVVHVADGTYTGFQTTRSGTSSNPIAFRADGSGAVVNQQNSSTPDNINIEGADYVVIDGFVVNDAPRVGIRAVLCTGVIVRNNIVSRSGLTGILSGWTPSIQVLNNVVSTSLAEHGIYISNSNTPNDNPIVRGNECYGNNENGIQFNGDCWEGGDGIISGAVIENNVIHDNNWKGMSLISVQNSTIQNNVFYDNGVTAGAGAIHLTDQVGPSCGKPSSNNTVVNNTMIEPRIACVRMTDGSTGNVIFNNICVQPNSARWIVDEVGGNLIDGPSNKTATAATGYFVNDAAKDFQLKSGSAAIDAGKSSYQSKAAPAVDRAGKTRPGGAAFDAGAYEFGTPSPGDAVDPVASITSPASATIIRQAVAVTASATDNVGVASVQFFVDGAPLGALDTSAPYSTQLSPSSFGNGNHSLHAEAADAAGNVGLAPVVSVIIDNQSPTGILEGHPRLSLVGGRLQELRALACYDDNGNVISGCSRSSFATTFLNFLDTSSSAEAWAFALGYQVTGKLSYATKAIQMADAQVACGYTCIKNANNTFLYVRDFMRDICLVYDWLYDLLSPQQRADYVNYMNLIMFLTWNANSEANNIYDTQDWSTSNPNNNYFYNYILATTYVALATYGENPGTFTYNGTQHTLYLLMNGRDESSQRFFDVYEFLTAKLSQQGFPAMDGVGRGGGWLEGENYGRAMKRHIAEAFLLLKETAGLDYFLDPLHPFMRESARYQLYAVQPGGGILFSGGDASQEPTLKTNAYDRHVMLLLARGLASTVDGQYAQYYCNNVQTQMGGIPVMTPVDFFLADPSLPQRDFSELPTRYRAEGIDWMNSRSSWNSNAVSVSFNSTDIIEGHQHRDANQVVIYIGGSGNSTDGWILTDAQPYSSGLPRSSDWHNTYLIGGTSQRFGSGTGDMVKFEAAPSYTYAVGDASDAYWTNPGSYSHGDNKMVDVFLREVVHILPGYVVVFDRVSLSAGYTSQEVKCLFHYPYTKPAVSGGLVTATNDKGRLFQRVLMPVVNTINWVNEETLSSERNETWRMELKDATTRPSYQFLNVFYAAASTVTSMPLAEQITSADGNMVGAVIRDPAQEQVILFSKDPRGNPPVGDIIYQVGFRGDSQQQLFNLVPGMGYAVAVSGSHEIGYSVVLRPGGDRVASAEGSLAFTLDEILSAQTPVARR